MLSRKLLENISNISPTAEISRNYYEEEITKERRMLDIILFISSLVLVTNIVYILRKCECRKSSGKGEYASVCNSTLCDHHQGCPACGCAIATDPCDIHCCEKCGTHCKSHCTHSSSGCKVESLMSRIIKTLCPNKLCGLFWCRRSSKDCSNLTEIIHSVPVIVSEGPDDVKEATGAPIAPLISPPPCTCYDDRKDIEEKIKWLLKNAAKESSRGRIAAESAIINAVNQVAKFQKNDGLSEDGFEKEKLRIYCLVQKALKDIQGAKNCDMWSEETIIDETIQNIMKACSCDQLSRMENNRQCLRDLLNKAAFDFSHYRDNTESILESTVDEIIERRLIQEAPGVRAATGAPPEVRLRTYLKNEVALVLCAEPQQLDQVIEKVFRNIMRKENAKPRSAANARPSKEFEHIGIKGFHSKASELYDKRYHLTNDMFKLDLPKS